MNTALYYFHDPMCSWCWGFRPAWQKILDRLPEGIEVKYVLGGLAPDSREPMPEDMRTYLQKTWQTIHQKLGTEFNFDFWTKCKPRRSTYPACRAVIAAENQQTGNKMILAIQQAYYLRAMNPSDDETLITLAEELGLDKDKFESELNVPQTQTELERQIAFASQCDVQGLPTLVLELNEQHQIVHHDYLDPDVVIAQLDSIISN